MLSNILLFLFSILYLKFKLKTYFLLRFQNNILVYYTILILKSIILNAINT